MALAAFNASPREEILTVACFGLFFVFVLDTIMESLGAFGIKPPKSK